MIEELPHRGRGVGKMRVLSAGGDSVSGKHVSDITAGVVRMARYVVQKIGRG